MSGSKQNSTSSDMNVALDQAMQYLKSAQTENGFWPYLPAREGALEPSAWAAIACRADKSCVERFSKNILQIQNADGGWSNDSARLDSDWSTAAALLALKHLSIGPVSDNFSRVCKKGEAWLLDTRAEYYTPGARLALLIWKGPEYRYPQGWPWNKNTYAWVEPTAYVLLAFAEAERLKNKNLAQILEQGENFLLNLCCEGGGWNFGDHTPFGNLSAPDVQSSTLAILALKQRREEAKVKQSIKWLSEKVAKMESINDLSWALLALASRNEKCDELVERIVARQSSEGSFSSNILTHAIACLGFQIAAGQAALL